MASPCYIPGRLFITDFQNSVLDLANVVNPVIGQFMASAASGNINQMWNLIPQDDANSLFKIQNAQITVYLTNAPTGGEAPRFSQAITDSEGGIFELVCADTTSGSILHSDTGFTLTAWHKEEGSTITPVTFEAYTGRAEQIFTFVPAPPDTDDGESR